MSVDKELIKSNPEAARRAVLKERAARSTYERPRIPLDVRLWEWFSPESTSLMEKRKEHATIIVVVALVIVALAGLIGYNVWRMSGGAMRSRLVVADSAFVIGQEQNIIDDLELNGFRDSTYEEGLGVVAYGTDDMVEAYRQSFGDHYLKKATDEIEGNREEHEALGITTINHSDQWDTIDMVTYMDTADVDLFQYVLTDDADLRSALDDWIAWGVMKNGDAIKFRTLDISGTPYFEAEGISSVADILTAVKEQGVEGIDWNEVAGNLSTTEDGDGEGDGKASQETGEKKQDVTDNDASEGTEVE